VAVSVFLLLPSLRFYQVFAAAMAMMATSLTRLEAIMLVWKLKLNWNEREREEKGKWGKKKKDNAVLKVHLHFLSACVAAYRG